MKKISLVSVLLLVGIVAAGCFGIPTPSTSKYGISGRVKLGHVGWGLENVQIAINDGFRIAVTDQDGNFSISGLNKESYLVSVISPIGFREFYAPINEVDKSIEIAIELPEGVDLDLFYDLARLSSGVQRWENGSDVRYFVGNLSSNDAKDNAREAIHFWLDDLEPFGILTVEEVDKESDANFIFREAKNLKSKDGSDQMACVEYGVDSTHDPEECYKNVPPVKINEVLALIHDDYVDNKAPYYWAVGKALGLNPVTRNGSIMKHDSTDPNAVPMPSEQNYLNLLYSLKVGFDW